MVVLEARDSSQFVTYNPKGEETLLTKYAVPIQHLDFDYVSKCKDAREMEQIVQILHSGQEGHYPDLTAAAESRLRELKPKSKLLRKMTTVISRDGLDYEQRDQIRQDLTDWVENMSMNDSELIKFKQQADFSESTPQIRQQSCTKHERVNPLKRIKSTDYAKWDKYDPDTEILKMELQEAKVKEKYKNNLSKNGILLSRTSKTVQFKPFRTRTELEHLSIDEKNKANEFFKAGDYEEAIRHYTISIECKPNTVSFTNRALANLRLKNYKEALDDCKAALRMEPGNFKALLRQSQALEGLGLVVEALQVIQRAVTIDPNNGLAQDLAAKLRVSCGVVEKNTRLMIEEVDSKFESVKLNQSNQKIIIPIPGTSTAPPPHYIVVPINNPEKIFEETMKINAANQMIRLISVDHSDIDDDDSCSVNHLTHICTRTKRTVEKKHNHTPQPKLEEKKTTPTITKGKKPAQEKLDIHASGEPNIVDEDSFYLPHDLHAPFTFLKTWILANSDPTLERHAQILKSLNMNEIDRVIGCKLDNQMFSKIIKCLCVHMTVPGEVERLYAILTNIVNVPRFNIISMLLSNEDKNYIHILVNFLKQHGQSLPEDVVNKVL